MSKKHYQQFAAVFGDAMRQATDEQMALIADVLLPKFMTVCKADNPRFDSGKFLAALDEVLA